MRSDSPKPESTISPTEEVNASWVVIVVGVLLGFCMIGLTHADTYLKQHEHGVSVELGVGLDDQADFEKDVNAAPIYRKLGFLGLLCIAAFCYVTSPKGTRIEVTPVLIGAACCLFVVAASYFWSFGRNETARELVRIAAYTGVAYSFAKRFRPRELLTVLMLMAATSVIAACLVDVVMGGRPWQPNYRLHGTMHSNLLAHQALVALLVAFTLHKTSTKPWIWKSIFLAMFTVIVLTKTRGALASALFGLAAIWMIGQTFRSFVLITSLAGVLLTTGALVVLMAGPQVQQRLSNAATLGRSKGVGTLTGRIPLWEAVLDESKENRLKGYGYGAFWNSERTTKLSKQLDWYPGHSHSAYIQTVLDIGYFGLAVVLALVLTGLVQSATTFLQSGEHEYRFVFGLLAAGLIDGIVEVSFVYPRELGLFVGISLFTLIVAHPKSQAVGATEPAGADPQPATKLSWQGTQPAF